MGNARGNSRQKTRMMVDRAHKPRSRSESLSCKSQYTLSRHVVGAGAECAGASADVFFYGVVLEDLVLVQENMS